GTRLVLRLRARALFRSRAPSAFQRSLPHLKKGRPGGVRVIGGRCVYPPVPPLLEGGSIDVRPAQLTGAGSPSHAKCGNENGRVRRHASQPLLIALLCLLSHAHVQAADSPVAGVSRVVFLGDSITYSGQYIEAVEAILRVRDPKLHCEFLDLGLPSETVSGLS